MKSNLVLTIAVAVLATLVGCGKDKKSSGPTKGSVGSQGICSQSTMDLYREISKNSERPITNRTPVNEIYNSCQTLQQTLVNGTCQTSTRSNRTIKTISYSEVSGFCAEIATYVTPKNPAPPRPVPLPTQPNPRPPQYGQVLVENLNNRYALYFEKSYLDQDDLDVRDGNTRCRITLSDRINDNLRGLRATFVAMTVQINPRGATYDMTAVISRTRDVVRLTCRSHNNRLTVQELNKVLNGVAEVRQRQ